MADARSEIARLRDFAQRAQRLAPYFDDEDRARLLKHAGDLEQAAHKLESEIEPPRES